MSLSAKVQEKAGLIWAIADKLTGVYNPHEYGEVILSAKVPIIITTLQKFPVIYKEVQAGCRRFAIIIDEAHSSQTGKAAQKLKRALADTDKVLEEYARAEADDEVLLEYYRLRKDSEGEIKLETAEEGFRPITGAAGRREPQTDPLTVIIEQINERFGTNWTEMDKVLMQLQNDMAQEQKWQAWAKNADRRSFEELFNKEFEQIAVRRYEQNDSFFQRLFSEPEMMQMAAEASGDD